MSLQALCNLDVALDAVDGDRDLLCRMIQVFINQSPTLLREIRAAVERRAGVALWRAAHTLRGSACNFGADKTCDAAARLEQIGRMEDWAAVAEVQADLERTMASLHDALLAFSKASAP
jgi:protein-histidine pros-kinase